MKPDATPRVLLVGGSGFLGQYLVRACTSANIFVRVASRRPSNYTLQGSNIDYREGNYHDGDFLNSCLTGINTVVHLAHDNMRMGDFDIEAEFDRNILPSIRLMDACIASKITKLLFVSSGGTVYGNNASSSPIAEGAATNPVSLYGTSKLTIERLGQLYHLQKGLPFVIARPTNAYGPGQYPFRGQGFIPTAFASALEGQKLNIFGDGSAIRDYIHASDVAKALLLLINLGQAGETYNIGSAIGISLRQLLEDYIIPITKADGFELSYEYSASRGADVNYNVVDNSKILLTTGFSPDISLAAGLNETWSWLKQNTYK